jgi:hypothetical protein
MATVPPGSFDSMDALDAATVPAATPLADAAEPFVSQTQPPAISFSPQGNPTVSMAGFYITLDDTIQLTAWNGNPLLTSIVVQIRVLKPDGTLVIEAVVLNNLTSNFTANVAQFSQLEGFVVSAVVGPPGVALQRGQCFVNLSVVRGAQASLIEVAGLIADYLSTAFQPCWPQGQVQAATNGAGAILFLTGTEPTPGNEAIVNQPAGTRWLVTSCGVQMQTSAAAGNRQLSLTFINAGFQLFKAQASVMQAPSTTATYSFGIGVPMDGSSPLAQLIPLPSALILSQSCTLETVVENIQAADQVSGLQLALQEWIDV